MNARPDRASLALVLTVAAIAVPCGAWFVVGSREAHRRAVEIEQAPQRLAREAAARLADRLRDRLETLRANEAKRPFYHYQNFYHDPRGAYEGAAVVPSPLSQGALDPIIRTYFQLDASGRFTLPQLNEQLADATAQQEATFTDLVALRKQLELQAPTYVAVVNEPRQQTVQPVAPRSATSQSRRVEVLDQRAWAQNVAATEYYNKLRTPERLSPKEARNIERLNVNQGDVQVSVGPLQWHNILINRASSLVALRDVQTPYGRNVQGFLIAAEGIADLLRASPLPAHFHDGPPAADTDAGIVLDNRPWHISVDAALDLADARAQAAAVRREFLRLFGWGTTAAGIAGLCVVGLVWQTERLARQRSQFAASAAHELRTPLAGLRLYSDMLADGLGDPAQANTYARRIADEAERLGRVVANVLGFSRLERGTLQLHPVPGDLAAAVRAAVARQLPALEALGVTVKQEIADALPPVKFDPDAVAQILQNLLDNAEKHTRQATDRTIVVSLVGCSGASVKRRPFADGSDRRLTEPPLQQPTHVELTVADHGPGVSRKMGRRLFRPFMRNDHPDAPAGIGLGLVLVKKLVEAQAGTVAYRDNAGGGARFVVTLPV